MCALVIAVHAFAQAATQETFRGDIVRRPHSLVKELAVSAEAELVNWPPLRRVCRVHEHGYQRMRFIGHSEAFIKMPAVRTHTRALLMCVAHCCHVLTDRVLSKASPYIQSIENLVATRREQRRWITS